MSGIRNIYFLLLISTCWFSCQNSPHERASISGFTYNDSLFFKAKALAQEGLNRQALLTLSPYLSQIDASTEVAAWDPRITILAGNLYFSSFNIDSAVHFWEKTKDIADYFDNDSLMASVTTNLGAAFLQKKFHHTAFQYFQVAKEHMEKLDMLYDSYHITCYNLARTLFNLNQYHDADSILQIIHNSPYQHVRFLYYGLRSEIDAANNDIASCHNNMDSAKKYLPYLKMYIPLFHIHELSLLLELHDTSGINKYLSNQPPKYSDQDIQYQMLFNKAYYVVNRQLYVDTATFTAYENQIATEDNTIKELYYELLSQYYQDHNNKPLLLHSLQQLANIRKDILNEKTNIMREDFLSSGIITDNKILKTENELNKVRYKKQKDLYRISFLLVSIIIISLLIFYLRLNRYKNLLKHQVEKMAIVNKALKESKMMIEYKLSEEKNRWEKTNQTLKKTAILKNQLGQFFNEIGKPSDNKSIPEKLVNKAKLNFYAFFKNYQDLALLAANDSEILHYLENITTIHPGLSEKEIQVLSLILSGFTTTEVGTLLHYSPKNIEYYRTSIRKKLQIPEDIQITDFCKNEARKFKSS
jgi:hypothetical protein